MKKIQPTHYIIPLYLLTTMLILTPLTLTNTLLITIPILLISFSLYLKHTLLGIISLSLFYLLSLQTLTITTMETLTTIILYLILLILPSIILLSQILQQNHPHTSLLATKNNKPLITTIILTIALFITFYLITLILPNSDLLSTDTLEIQILILSACSIFYTIPLLIK